MKYQLIFIFLLCALLVAPELWSQSKYIKRVDKQLTKGDTSKAIKKLNKFIDKSPESAELYMKRALLKIERGDLDPAMVDLNNYCHVNKSCGKANYYKGIIRYKQNDYNGAIDHLSKYTLVTEDANAWFHLGISHMRLQNYPLAINAFERSIKIDNQQALSYYNAGLAAFYSDQFSQADGFFEKAIELLPADSDFKIAKANALLKLNSFAEGNKLLRTIDPADRNYPSALYNIAVNYYHLNERDLACDYWRQARDVGHTNAADAISRYCGKKSGKVQKW
ncbi:MAG: tetratricopeptide repeat protein [Salibacteraceae bacterium]